MNWEILSKTSRPPFESAPSTDPSFSFPAAMATLFPARRTSMDGTSTAMETAPRTLFGMPSRGLGAELENTLKLNPTPTNASPYPTPDRYIVNTGTFSSQSSERSFAL